MKKVLLSLLTALLLHLGLAAQPGYSISRVPFHPDSVAGGTDVGVTSDDGFSPKIPLPFTFCFADSSYDTVVVGANGVVTFDAQNANGVNMWMVDSAAPSARYANRCIMAPLHDLYINGGGTITYNTWGVAPHRRFVVSFDSIPLYDASNACGSPASTQQIILYETSNIIEVHVGNKPICTAWNGGRAILGIQVDSTSAFIPIGYNAPAQWTAAQESWRFTPYGNCPGPVDDIGGRVTTSTNASLQFQQVYMLRYDTTLRALIALDSVLTDADGYYAFNNVSDTLVYLKAVPDSTDYPNEMPTYADHTMYWNTAFGFRPRLYPAIIRDFQTVYGANPGGPGFVSGIVTEGANKAAQVGDPIRGIRLVMREMNTGDVIGYRDTDVNGYFSFGNVPLGDYEIVPDKPMISITNVPQITVSNQALMLDSLDLVLHSSYLELVTHPAAAPAPATAFAVQVVPNPFSQAAELRLDLPMTRTVRIRLLDMLGRPAEEVFDGILPSGVHHFAVGEGKATGCYFLQITANGYTQVLKLVKSE